MLKASRSLRLPSTKVIASRACSILRPLMLPLRSSTNSTVLAAASSDDSAGNSGGAARNRKYPFSSPSGRYVRRRPLTESESVSASVRASKSRR